MSKKSKRYVPPYERDLKDDHVGSGAAGNGVSFLNYVRKHARDDKSPLQDAAKKYLSVQRELAKFKDFLDREFGDPTPGDWYVDQLNPQKHEAVVRADRPYPQYVPVALIRAETISGDELVANANLIAAAPKLLAALKQAAFVFEKLNSGGLHPGTMLAAMRQAKKAIKQATQKKPLFK